MKSYFDSITPFMNILVAIIIFLCSPINLSARSKKIIIICALPFCIPYFCMGCYIHIIHPFFDLPIIKDLIDNIILFFITIKLRFMDFIQTLLTFISNPTMLYPFNAKELIIADKFYITYLSGFVILDLLFITSICLQIFDKLPSKIILFKALIKFIVLMLFPYYFGYYIYDRFYEFSFFLPIIINMGVNFFIGYVSILRTLDYSSNVSVLISNI